MVGLALLISIGNADQGFLIQCLADNLHADWHLVLVERCYDKALTSCCVQAAVLILEYLCLILAEVPPIAQAVPADCIAVKDTKVPSLIEPKIIFYSVFMHIWSVF